MVAPGTFGIGIGGTGGGDDPGGPGGCNCAAGGALCAEAPPAVSIAATSAVAGALQAHPIIAEPLNMISGFRPESRRIQACGLSPRTAYASASIKENAKIHVAATEVSK
jgi:hypothetical protein